MSEIGIVSFLDPDGQETVLTKQDAFDVIGEIEGHGLPPIIFQEDRVPGHPGARFRSATHGPREVAVPVLTNATEEMTLGERIREFGLRLDPVRGQGLLRWERDEETRELECRYTGGFELRQRHSHFHVGVLIFRASDNPYWVDADDTLSSFGQAVGEAFFPFLPLTVGPDSVLTETTVFNTGDVETWPVWTIHGPGSGFVFENATTGKTIELDTEILEGESITIDTRPGQKTVRKDDGTNLFPAMSYASELWPLARGGNVLSLTALGSDESSNVQLRYRRRWLVV